MHINKPHIGLLHADGSACERPILIVVQMMEEAEQWESFSSRKPATVGFLMHGLHWKTNVLLKLKLEQGNAALGAQVQSTWRDNHAIETWSSAGNDYFIFAFLVLWQLLTYLLGLKNVNNKKY